MIALHMCAPQDNNGNPRRCFVVFDAKGEIRAVIDEGYAGRGILRAWAKKHRVTVHDAGVVSIPPAEYREFLRHKNAQ